MASFDTTGALMGAGNPILDMSANVDDATMTKYGMKPGDIVLAEEKHMPVYKELEGKPDLEYIAGGATLNSIRVASWMMGGAPGTASYVGCIGDDAYGKKMAAGCAGCGVNANFMVDAATPTGSCAVLIRGAERALIANLSAANNYKVDHLKTPESMAMLESA